MLTPTLEFTTDNVPPADRLRSWHSVFDRSVSRRQLSPLSDGPFHMHVTVSNLPGGNNSTGANTGVCVQRMSFTAGFSAQRTGDLLADGNDDVVLYLHRSGRRLVSQLGRETEVEPGGGILSSNAHASTVIVPEPSHFICIALPRKPILALVPNLEDLLARSVPANNGVLQLLESYLTVLEREESGDTPELRHSVVTHIHDLVAVALGCMRDHIEIANGRGIRAARLHAIKSEIAKNLARSDLSAGALAARHGVTPRYIHKLFESDGTTLSRFILGQRLSLVHRKLTDIRNAGQTIGALAFAAGFGDLSTFNHAFRRHFGATPSDVRVRDHGRSGRNPHACSPSGCFGSSRKKAA